MSIVFDGYTLSSATPAGSSSLTFSRTTPTNTNRLLMVGVVTYNFSTGTPSPTVTYNGVSMTMIQQNIQAFNVNNWRVHLYRLVAPDEGTFNVVVTATSGTGVLRAHAANYYNVDQSNPILTNNTASTLSGATMDISLTTAEDAWWYISGANVDSNWTAGANTATIREPLGAIGFADSNGIISAQTGNARMTHTGTRGYGGIAVAIKPASGSPAPTTRNLMMMGVGI